MNIKIKPFSILLSFSVILSCLTGCAKNSETSRFNIKPVGNKSKQEFSLNYQSGDDMLSEMEKVCENNRYALFYDAKSLSTAVKDINNGKIYFSNPYNCASDAYYTGNIKNSLESQIEIQYADKSGKTRTLYSSADSVKLGQYEVDKKSKGLEIVYSVGEEKDRQLVPPSLGKSEFENILKKISDESVVKKLKSLYKEDETDSGEKIYKARKLSERERNYIDKYMQQAGYTYEDLEKDVAAYGADDYETVFPNFRIVLSYELTNNGLTVTADASQIRYDKSNFALVSLTILKYFGAVDADDTNSNDGYLFLPDGCGTIVSFGDQYTNRQELISGMVYGEDNTKSSVDSSGTEQPFYMPVFGIKTNDAGVFSIITEGSALARISGYAEGQAGGYYTACASFSYAERETEKTEQRSSATSTTQYYIDDNCYTGNYKMQYYFLDKDNSSYVGMANLYRTYLNERGLKNEPSSDNCFLSLETIGTVLSNESFLGINYKKEAQLTSFDDNISLLQALDKKGINKIALQLSAWRSDGFDGIAPTVANASSVLGGKKKLIKLGNWCEKNNIELYPDIDMAYVKKDGFSDNFSAKKDAAFLLNGKYAGYRKNSPVTEKPDESSFKYIISPRAYDKILKRFAVSYSKLGISSLGLGTLGNNLNSDYSKNNAVNREQALNGIEKTLESISADYSIMVNGGNAYAFQYASFIKGVPVTDSGYRGTDRVPFLQLVLSGSVAYSSESINFSTDKTTMLLYCIESRTAPQFTMVKRNSIKLKNTNYTEYYSVNSEYLVDEAADLYLKYKSAISVTENAKMISHEIVSEDVVKVKYSNGAVIYVNYNSEPVICDDCTVPGRSFLAIGGTGVE